MLIHVGYPKASSTFLQESLFRADHGYCPLYGSKDDRGLLTTMVVDAPIFRFDVQQFKLDVESRLKRVEGRDLIPVISAEGLIGSQFDPIAALSKVVADRIAEACPNAKIMIVVREQRSMILSIYFQYVRGGGIKSLEDYLHADGLPVHRQASWSGVYPAFLEYDCIVEYYQRLFGRDSVMILPLEMLIRDAPAYLDRITRFSGAKTDIAKVSKSTVKQGIPANVIGLRRFANALLSNNPDNPFSFLLPAPLYWRGARHAKRTIENVGRNFNADHAHQHYRERLDTIFQTRFADNNRRLAQMSGLDLASYGYRL
jgi:hypothetical protein